MAMTTELNMVEGFNPADYARMITDADGQQSQYLDVQYRKMWFRLRNPNGKIVKKICSFDGNLAVIEAKIYLDRNDPPENFVSNAFAQRFVDPNNPDYGNRYLESAETAAVGRALADAGYGLQFCLERDPTPVDMGQQFFGQPDMMPVEDSISTITETSVNPYAQPAPVKTQIGTQEMMYAPGYQMPNNQQGYNPQYGNIPQPAPAAPAFTNQMPVEQIMQKMPYEEAVKVVYHCNGKHNGKTLGQIAVEDFSSIKWLTESYRGDKNLYKAAARIILNRHTGGNG